MGYLCLLGFLVLIGMLSVSCGLLAGRMSGLTPVASLTSFLIYSGLLFAGCWLLYQSIPPEPVGMPPEVADLNTRVLAQAARDVITGNDYEHRKGWIESRLAELARIFAIDACVYALLSNHFHLLMRNRPDLVLQWSDEEVAQRWWQLCPLRFNEDGSPAGVYSLRKVHGSCLSCRFVRGSFRK